MARASKKILNGGDYFIILMYQMVLWEAYKSKSTEGKAAVRAVRKSAIVAFMRYLFYSKNRMEI